MSIAARRAPENVHEEAWPPGVPKPPPGQDELPYDDGEPMESPKHRLQMNLLIETLQTALEDRPEVYIGGNMALYYSELQAKNQDFRAPHFFVVLQSDPERARKSWVLWQEDGRTPDLVIELLSETTEAVDRGRKMQIYAGLRVTEYGLYDVDDERLELYRLKRGVYERVPHEPNGDVVSQVLDLALGVADGIYHSRPCRLLRWKTLDGALLPTGDESTLVERARAAAEAARAEAEKTRAETEAARAEAEKTRAEAAEARAAALEAKLRALGLDPTG